MPEMTRTHVVLPKALVDEVDRLVGPRHRSEFLAAAAEKELRHRRLLEAARAAAGSLTGVDIPDWETSESAAAWVRKLRAADTKRLEGSRGGA